MEIREVVVVGGGIAGLSAAIYLARAQRNTLVIDSGHSMAKWEPEVENYLGFPKGVDGEDLLTNGRKQAERYGADFASDTIKEVTEDGGTFFLRGDATYRARRVLLATGIYHIPPDIPGVRECLGHSMFFCKDCDGVRVRGKRIAVIGANDDTVEYALAMLHYSPRVMVAANGDKIEWDQQHAAWLKEYEIPVEIDRVRDLRHRNQKIKAL